MPVQTKAPNNSELDRGRLDAVNREAAYPNVIQTTHAVSPATRTARTRRYEARVWTVAIERKVSTTAADSMRAENVGRATRRPMVLPSSHARNMERTAA